MDQAQRDALIVKHIGLPGLVYSRMEILYPQVQRLGREEAIAVGAVALVEAARRPNLDPDRFVRFAWAYIKYALLDAAGENSLVRIPPHARQDGVPLPHVGPLPSFDELSQTNEDLALRIETEALRTALAALPAEHQRVLHARFWEARTCQDIASAIGVTREAVRQREARALRDVRDVMEGKPLRRPGGQPGKRAPSPKPRRPQSEYVLR